MGIFSGSGSPPSCGPGWSGIMKPIPLDMHCDKCPSPLYHGATDPLKDCVHRGKKCKGFMYGDDFPSCAGYKKDNRKKIPAWYYHQTDEYFDSFMGKGWSKANKSGR